MRKRARFMNFDMVKSADIGVPRANMLSVDDNDKLGLILSVV